MGGKPKNLGGRPPADRIEWCAETVNIICCALGVTQEHIVHATEISASTVWRWLKAKDPLPPTREQAQAILALFVARGAVGLTLEDLGKEIEAVEFSFA